MSTVPTRRKERSKVMDLYELASRLSDLRKDGKTIVHCHGVFDLCHVGHIRHLKEAKSMGDVLVVTITPDRYVNRGPHRPAFTEALRAELLAALDMVDYVAINQWQTAVETIKLLRPVFYVKGPDYAKPSDDITGGISVEEAAIVSAGGQLRTTNDITYSSSNLLNRFMTGFSPEVGRYLDEFRSRHSAAEIIGYLDRIRPLKTLVIGEAILDHYVYCDTLGKSGKEPILAMRYLSHELNAGGVLAIARHLSGFLDFVDLATYLGATNSQESFIRERLKPNVRPEFIYKSDSPTIVKRRYVDNYSLAKLFEVYEFNDEFLTEREENALYSLLEPQLSDFDVVIAADFGHGLITPRITDLLCRKTRFLAVNTQLNAANTGFNSISKYPRADYLCVHDGEIRLDTRSRLGDIKTLVSEVAQRSSCPTIMVTRGSKGTLLYRVNRGFVESPALALKVVDRIGAGDAVLALTATLVAARVPEDVVGFIANVIGAQAVQIVCNRTSIERIPLIKHIESLLK